MQFAEACACMVFVCVSALRAPFFLPPPSHIIHIHAHLAMHVYLQCVLQCVCVLHFSICNACVHVTRVASKSHFLTYTNSFYMYVAC